MTARETFSLKCGSISLIAASIAELGENMLLLVMPLFFWNRVCSSVTIGRRPERGRHDTPA